MDSVKLRSIGAKAPCQHSHAVISSAFLHCSSIVLLSMVKRNNKYLIYYPYKPRSIQSIVLCVGHLHCFCFKSLNFLDKIKCRITGLWEDNILSRYLENTWKIGWIWPFLNGVSALSNPCKLFSLFAHGTPCFFSVEHLFVIYGNHT